MYLFIYVVINIYFEIHILYQPFYLFLNFFFGTGRNINTNQNTQKNPWYKPIHVFYLVCFKGYLYWLGGRYGTYRPVHPVPIRY